METNGLLSGNCVTVYKSQDEGTATVVRTEPRLLLMNYVSFMRPTVFRFVLSTSLA